MVSQYFTNPATPCRWKHRLVAVTVALISVSFPIFPVAGGAALYWAWIRANSNAALPFLPWNPVLVESLSAFT